jgi:hypothetical protein
MLLCNIFVMAYMGNLNADLGAICLIFYNAKGGSSIKKYIMMLFKITFHSERGG